MAAVDSLLNAAPAAPPEPDRIQQPFAATTSYFVPKLASAPVWKVGFRCRSDQNYKSDGALVFCTNDKCKNSAGLPVGHKNEFPFSRKWKTGDGNQIMLIHCRNKHKEELAALDLQAQTSSTKAVSSQKDVREMLNSKSPVTFDEAKLGSVH
jgi:hypothetical protein